MIIYLICTMLFVVSLIVTILVNKKAGQIGSGLSLLSDEEVEKLDEQQKATYKKWKKREAFALKMLVPTFLFGLIVILSTVGFRQHLPGYKDELLAEKSLIIYKAQNGEFEDNGDMIKAIDDFNDDLKSKKKALESPWINWYVSRHYKDIKPINYTIDLEDIEYKN